MTASLPHPAAPAVGAAGGMFPDGVETSTSRSVSLRHTVRALACARDRSGRRRVTDPPIGDAHHDWLVGVRIGAEPNQPFTGALPLVARSGRQSTVRPGFPAWISEGRPPAGWERCSGIDTNQRCRSMIVSRVRFLTGIGRGFLVGA